MRAFKFTQITPAGLPFGMPGNGDVIDGAMQQAPQPRLHSISNLSFFSSDSGSRINSSGLSIQNPPLPESPLCKAWRGVQGILPECIEIESHHL